MATEPSTAAVRAIHTRCGVSHWPEELEREEGEGLTRSKVRRAGSVRQA